MKEFFKKYKKEIIIILIFVFFALGFSIFRVQSDGFLYYEFLERMLHLPSPERPLTVLENAPFIQSGCAYFNAPFYLIAYAIENLFSTPPNFNGITLRQISINLASIFYMILSLILAVKILKKMDFRHIIIPTLAVLFSTAAFAAAVVIPSFNHTVDIFVTTLFIYLLLGSGKDYLVRSFWLGVFVVIVILVRYLNFVLIITAIAYYLSLKEYKKIKYFLLGFLTAAWIIPLIFYIYNGTISPLYGTGFTTQEVIKSILMPKNSLKLFVHPLHGLFVWSPVTILSALGLLYFPKGKEKLGYLLLGTWVIFLIMHGFILEWHAGWSFSNRYLVSMFPIYILGLSAFLEKYGKRTVLLVAILTFYSIILFLNWHLCIFQAEFGTPADMVKAWIKGESDTFMDGKVNIKTFLHRLWEWCRYKYIFRILK